MYNHGMQNYNQDQVFYNLNRQFAGRGLARQAKVSAESYGREGMYGSRGTNSSPLTLGEFEANYRRRNSYSNATAGIRTAVQYENMQRQPSRKASGNQPTQRNSEQPTRTGPAERPAVKTSAKPIAHSEGEKKREQLAVTKKNGSQKVVKSSGKGVSRRSVTNMMKKLDPDGKGAAWGNSLKDSITRVPVGMLFMVMLCVVSLMLIVSSSVLVSDASGSYADEQDSVSALAKQEDELLIALEVKNDLRTIENIAVNELGMVKKDLVTRQYIKLSDEDVIETFEEEDRNVGLSTLLSAISKGN